MLLKQIIHDVADRAYQELRQLQSDCSAASDKIRQQKMLFFFEIQRHRALQEFALYRFCEEDAQLLVNAITAIGKPKTSRLESIRGVVSKVDMSAHNFEGMTAPEFDVKAAVDSLVNGRFHGLPTFIDSEFKSTADEDDDTDEPIESRAKRLRLMKNRVSAKVLQEEIDFATLYSSRFHIGATGELAVDRDLDLGFIVKLALTKAGANLKWYPSSLRISIKSRENAEDIQFISTKHVPDLSARLEDVLATISSADSSVIVVTTSFMRRFCGELVLAMIESQAKMIGIAYSRGNVMVNNLDYRYVKVKMGLEDWWFSVSVMEETTQDDNQLCAYSIEHEILGRHSLEMSQLEGAELKSISLRRMLASAGREASRWQLEHLKSLILMEGRLTVTKHHGSQVRVVLRQDELDYEMRLDLVMSGGYLTAQVNATDGSIEFFTTSKTHQWKFASMSDALKNAGDVWAQAEARDALACFEIEGLTDTRSASLPPSPEIAKRMVRNSEQKPNSSAFWDLGIFEGFRYVLVVSYIPPASAFHASFLSKPQKLNECMRCELISFAAAVVPSTSEEFDDFYRSEQFNLSEISTRQIVMLHVTKMREFWAFKKLESECGLFRSDDDGLWRSNDPDIQSLQPYDLVFAEEGDESMFSCFIRCRVVPTPSAVPPTEGDRIWCPRGEFIGSAFRSAIRKNAFLERLANCSTEDVKINYVRLPDKKYCVLLLSGGQYQVFVGFEKQNLQIISPSYHPLVKLISEKWERDGSVENLMLGIGLISDAYKLITAARKLTEDFTREKKRRMEMRVRPTSMVNLYFVFDFPEEAYSETQSSRMVVACRLDGKGGAYRWQRTGWQARGPMMQQTQDTVEVVVGCFSMESVIKSTSTM